MKKTLKFWLIGAIVGILAGPSNLFAAASGNYTDLLPIGAAGNTTVISNGSGWSLTTLAPAVTFGDSLSRAPFTAYQSTSTASLASSVAVSTLTSLPAQGFVGSSTMPTGWLAIGRSIRISIRGNYGTTGTPNWTWGIQLGTSTIVQTGAVAAPTGVTSKPFNASATITFSGTGTSGSVNTSYDVFVTTATPGTSSVFSNLVSYSTATALATPIDLSSPLAINPVFTWGTSSSANTITINNATIEYLN